MPKAESLKQLLIKFQITKHKIQTDKIEKQRPHEFNSWGLCFLP